MPPFPLPERSSTSCAGTRAVLVSARHLFTPCAASDAPGCASPHSGLWWIPPSPFFIALDSLPMHYSLLASAAGSLGFVCTLELSAASPAAFITSLPLLRLLWVLLCSSKRTESRCWMQPTVYSQLFWPSPVHITTLNCCFSCVSVLPFSLPKIIMVQ